MHGKDVEFKIRKIEGRLDIGREHIFVVGLDQYRNLVYAGKTKVPLELRSHSDLADWLQIKAMGGGNCIISGNVLSVGGFSGTYGAVPNEILEKFDLLPHYQKLHPDKQLIDIRYNAIDEMVDRYTWRGLI